MQTSIQDLSISTATPAESSHTDMSKQHLSIQNAQPGHKRQREEADVEVEVIRAGESEKEKHGESARKKKRKNKTKDGEQ